MDVADINEVLDRMQPILRGYLREAGLPSDVAHSVRLLWNGSSFSVTSPIDLTPYEYGDGKGPSPRPVHKSLNRLSKVLEEELQRSLLDHAAATVSPW